MEMSKLVDGVGTIFGRCNGSWFELGGRKRLIFEVERGDIT